MPDTGARPSAGFPRVEPGPHVTCATTPGRATAALWVGLLRPSVCAVARFSRRGLQWTCHSRRCDQDFAACTDTLGVVRPGGLASISPACWIPGITGRCGLRSGRVSSLSGPTAFPPAPGSDLLCRSGIGMALPPGGDPFNMLGQRLKGIGRSLLCRHDRTPPTLGVWIALRGEAREVAPGVACLPTLERRPRSE